jgi:hypothetical protein
MLCYVILFYLLVTKFLFFYFSIFRDVIEAQDAVNFIRKRLAKKFDVDQIAKDLVQAALDRGSVDNVTAVIIAFHVHTASPSPDSVAS